MSRRNENDDSPSAAVAAEPGGIGTSGARDPLAVEVRLLGALLGQVIAEQAGAELFALVERIRKRTIALRKDDDPAERARLDDELRGLDLGAAEAVIGAFALYFGLVNLAEAHGRVRALRRRERTSRDGILDDSIGDAVRRLRRAGRSDGDLDSIIAHIAVSPVLTAHPTEARRRTTLVALRRCGALLEQLDDPRLTPSQDRDIRRRLREEITLLWRTSDLRVVSPTPLDEVRTAMAFFDATLFTVVPRLYRAMDAALDPPAGRSAGPAADTGRSGTRPPGWHRSSAGGPGSAAIGTATRTSPRNHREDPSDPGRPRPARLRSSRDAADADARGRRPDATGSRADRVRLARDAADLPEAIASSAGASRTSRIGTGSGSSQSGSAAPACADR